MHGFVSYRRFGRARSLRSDQAVYVLDRYIATEFGLSSIGSDQARLELGRYVATEHPSCVRARSLHSDRAWLVRGPMAILELVRGRFGYGSVAFGQSVFSGSIEIGTRF
ncbi:hypothetical protein DY000_02021103 [Brassica cretica]|uniref:Uncharacterized protein n=1 Tax=Brassica cretica TaxID=69181 RepID=A0ABQ7ECX2_BRACR|nr:hypothetical protein DY000_02021103 [Brassica cretica]